MKLFKKKKNKSIDVIISPLVLEENKEEFVKDVIEPCLKSQPEWWKALRIDMMKNIGQEKKLNVKTCPAFIELFKNSYVIKSPCDWLFEAKPGEYWKFQTSNEKLATAEDHDLDIQMNSFSNGSLYNFKLRLPASIKSAKGSGQINLVHMQPSYHNYNFPLTVMPGIMPLIEDTHVNLNINYVYENAKHIKFMCKKGDVLAYLYCAEKTLPPFNINLSDSYGYWTWFINKFRGSYLNKLNENYK